jgi:tetratricopeptide (TPR) repeat protein
MSDTTDPLTRQLPRETQLQRVLDDLRQHFRRNDPIDVETLLENYPSLRDDTEAVLDLIYQEMLLREESGRRPELAEYLRRFPALAEQLRAQFEVEQVIGDSVTNTAPSLSAKRPAGLAPAPQGLADYDILEELGRGGMGVVYKARQRALDRVVALKMMRPGACGDAGDLARFRIEAQAVARLQHPNIVQIFEVGEHDGQPFLVLEYVGGGSLARHLEGDPLPPPEAARLVETLARAIHHAHAQGIVHRDLKPANVLLVAGGGWRAAGQESSSPSPATRHPPPATPKITDFGLAKLLQSEQTGLTDTGSFLGTPTYAAPEQALGRVHEIGPLTDVYALGAILYELLTGRPPFRGTTALDTLDQVRSSEPVPPSRVRQGVPRDLETICLKCLQKERDKRYGSALHLAEDLRRFQDGLPILARPVGTAERVWKWARRRPALATLAVVGALILVGLPMGLWAAVTREANLRRLTEHHFAQALQAVEQMLLVVSEVDLADVPQMGPVRKQLLLKARALYREFLAERGDDPTVRREAGRLSSRLGDIFEMLDENREAEQAYLQAIQLLSPTDDPPLRRRELARAQNNLGVLFKKMGRYKEADAALRAALRGRGQLADEFPDEAEFQRELAISQYHRGTVLARLAGQSAGAERAYREALRRQEGLTKSEPGKADFQDDEARTLNNLGKLLAGSNSTEAEKLLRRAVTIHVALHQKSPEIPARGRRLAQSANNLAVLLRVGNPSEAERFYRLALDKLTRLSLDYPTVPAYRQDLAGIQNNLGMLLENTGQAAEAEVLYRGAVAIRQKWADSSPEVPDYQLKLAQIQLSLAVVLDLRGRTPEAERFYGQAGAGLRDLVKKHRQDPEYENELGVLLFHRAGLLSRRSRWAEPCRIGQVVLASGAGEWASFLPPVVWSQADLFAARDCLREAVPHQRAALDGQSQHKGYRKSLYESYFELTNYLLRLGDHEEAARTAVVLPRLYPEKKGGKVYVDAAEFLARCVGSAACDGRIPEDQRRVLQEKYAAECVAQLNRAIDRGFRGTGELTTSPAYQPLRERPDFRRLLDRLRASAPVVG